MNDDQATPVISDDDILSLWYTVHPSHEQHSAMTYVGGPYDVTCPTFELRRFAELVIQYARGQK